jgi:hypothetical protein
VIDRVDSTGMREHHNPVEDLPIIPVLWDRRRNPDRRAKWRGGRRDSDWTCRRPVSYETLTGLSPVHSRGRLLDWVSPSPNWRPALPGRLGLGSAARMAGLIRTLYSNAGGARLDSR